LDVKQPDPYALALRPYLGAEERRRMLREQLERGEVGDPITMTILGVTFWQAMAGVAISAGLSIGAGYLMAALNRRHMVSGYRGNEEVAVQRSAQGTPIPDIFGGDPGDGKGGGIKFAPIVAWLSKDSQGYVARKHSFKSGGSGGKGHLFSPAQQSVTQYSYDLDALLLWCRGPAQLRELWAGPDIIYRADFVGTDAYYEAEVGTNVLAGGAAVISDVAASGGQAVTIPPGGSLTFTGVAGDGSASQLDFFYKSTAPIVVQFTWIGGLGTAVFNDTLNSTAGTYTRGYNSAPFVLGNGTGNSVKIKNLDSTNTLTFDRLGVLLADGPVGVPNPSVPTDPSYDPYAPPPPRNANGQPVVRLQGMLSIDPTTNALVGQLGGGNYANVAMYEGNGTELPDPVVQAQEDANRGSGSTIAYRQFCTTRLSNFFLDRYQMAFPPMWGLLQSKTLRTLKDICEWLCQQCGLQPSDYDFTDLASINVRGCIANPPYVPADLMETLAEVYDCYFYESDKIYGKRISSAPVVNLTDADLAWTDDDREDDQQFVQVLDAELPAASDVARRVTVRYVSPARNFDQQQQNEYRMISTSNKEETWDIQVCLADDEARALAAKRLYNDEIRSVPYNFTLTDARLYDDPGTIYQITNADGSTHFCTLETIKPTLGVCDCTALEYDSAVFTQVGPAPGIVLTTPPVRAYGSSILGIYDGIALRVNDEGMVGFYAWVTQQTGSGEWTNAALYKEVQGVPDRIASFNAQATAGATVTALGSYPIANIGTEDGAQAFTVSGSTITPTANYYLNGETVMFSGSGTLPAPLNSTTLYYVVSSSGATLRVALTSGGTAITLTTAGSGQILIQRVVDVDLYGTTASLASVTSAQIATGANACLFNNEVVLVRTWQRVVGYTNRWRGSNLTRGQRNTQQQMAVHTAGERFVQLDSAVQFVEQAANQIGVNLQLRAVSEGQVYADAALVQHTLLGGSVQYAPVLNLAAQRISSTNDIYINYQPQQTGGTLHFLFRLYDAAHPAVVLREFTLEQAETAPLIFTRIDQLTDGTPNTNDGSCAGHSSVSTDGSYTLQSDGAASTACTWLSQEIRGDCIIQFDADTRSTPGIVAIFYCVPRAATVDPVGNTISLPGIDVDISDGQVVQIDTLAGGTLPGGLSTYPTTYYVVNYDGAETFQVAATQGGAAIDITSAGSKVVVAVNAVNAPGLIGMTTQTPSASTDPVFIMPEQATLLKKQAVARESYAIVINGRHARYYVPWTGDERAPTYQSAALLPNPFRVSCSVGAFGGSPLNRPEAMVRPRVTLRDPFHWTYTRAMQNADTNNTPPAQVLVEVRQVSYVGSQAIEGVPSYVTV
jgi:hypothetical protein